MKGFSGFLLKLLGWKMVNNVPEIKKAVIIVAPHTSLFDFFLGRFGFWYLGANSRMLIKKEAFKWPWGKLLRKVGGIPVNRGKSTKLTEVVADLFRKNDSLFITITPEGTRHLVKHWKRGFYYIADAAKVPIILGTLDYKNKIGGMIDVFYPTGDFEKDLPQIQEFYKNIAGRHPEKSYIFESKE